jgi:hypothetical protein
MIAGLLAGTARLIAGSSVNWVDPPGPDARIYIANHSSHLDFIVLWSFLPPDVRARVRPVAARDYWNSGIRVISPTRSFMRFSSTVAGGPQRCYQQPRRCHQATRSRRALRLGAAITQWSRWWLLSTRGAR